jgi:hypothetical protein
MRHSEDDLRILKTLRENIPTHKMELMESIGGACWSATVIKFDPH